ncbi:MAG: hypothetical protein ACLGID_01020 [Gammaproteobacteria bacterium]|uniref:hypothetical protein n=1 Tax=Pseudomonas sp. OTU750018 TaxID=2709708 RepID=UPI001423FEDB|nr:hypothetical protein [Pseudomonas sp. OTU750018]
MLRSICFCVLLSFATCSFAEMQEMADEELSSVQGAGFGFVLDGIMLDASAANITINDIERVKADGTKESMPVKLSEFYLSGSGSNKGANKTPVTLGRLNHPFTVTLGKGEEMRALSDTWEQRSKVVREGGVNKTVQYWAPSGASQWVQTTPSNVAVLTLAFPERMTSGGSSCIGGYAGAGLNCSSDPSGRADLGMRFDFSVGGGRKDILDFDLAQLTMDGSYLRLWGDNSRKQLVGEALINIFAKNLDISACTAPEAAANCSAAAALGGTLYLTNAYANIALGYGKSQPLQFDVNSNGQFVLELSNPVNTSGTAAQRNAQAADFYANTPRTNLVFDNMNIGYGRPPANGFANMPGAAVNSNGQAVVGAGGLNGGFNFGRNEISGLSFNYLKVTSRDL